MRPWGRCSRKRGAGGGAAAARVGDPRRPGRSAPAVGGLVVDLNFLHAPDSAHDPRRSTPQLPPDDVLDVVVPVGELLPVPPVG